MNVPFSLPLIDQDVVNEVNDALTNTGWLTSGPKVLELEKEISKLSGVDRTVCVNSWTSGAMLMLRWFGVGFGDEVIIPSYTYSATALVALNIGAKPIMVDVKDDFTIDPDKIVEAITPKTKAIIPVDIAGLPADYKSIFKVVGSTEARSLFQYGHMNQEKLGRILVLSDAAHSIGAKYENSPIGQAADATVFSLHSVKNVTTGEGGAIALNLPDPFVIENEYKFLKAFSLNGQTKSAFEKNQPGAWRYDIIDQGLKVNLPDINAAIGLAQIRKYSKNLLPDRERIFDLYNKAFSDYDWAIKPARKDSSRISSCHLYMLRVSGFDEEKRDKLIQEISKHGVATNVHYIPMAMLTLFKSRGYKISDYPECYKLYSNEITLPLYNGLKEDQVLHVAKSVIDAFNKIA